MANNSDSFLTELSRRNVWRVGIAYAVVSWLLIQIVDVVSDILELPSWIPKFFLVALGAGFLIALVFAWAYEMTPDGLKREKDVDRSQSITGTTAKRLNVITIVVLAAAVGFLLVDKYWLSATPNVDVENGGGVAVEKHRSPSIAVLPFTNMSEQESSRYFSDGLADTLLHMLAQVSDLRVAARTSSFQFRDTDKDIPEIAAQLQVSSILEGSVQRSGNMIRVTAQLINADDGYHLWSGNFDRELNDVFAIQDEIAAEVVSALQVSLLGGEVERLQRRQTDSVEAYTEYMLGIDAVQQFSFGSLPRAEQFFKRAIELDPDYALAHARLAQTYTEMYDTGLIGYEELLDKTAQPIQRALALDGDNVIAVTISGVLEAIRDNPSAAEATFRRAISLAPNEVLPRMQLARLLQQGDRELEAISIIEETMQLDPLSTRTYSRAASINIDLKRYDEARRAAKQLQRIDPQSPTGYYQQAFAEWADDRPAEAVQLMSRASEVDPSDPELPIQIGDWYADLSDFDGANYWYQKGKAIDPMHPMSETAMLYLDLLRGAHLGQSVEHSRRLLQRNIDNRKGSRELTLIALALNGEKTGDRTEFLEWAEHDYPEFFLNDPQVPANAFPMMGARIAWALQHSGDRVRGEKLAQAMLDAVLKSEKMGYTHFFIAALVDNRAIADQAIQEWTSNDPGYSIWEFSDEIHPWLGEYAQHPGYLAAKQEWIVQGKDRLAKINAAVGRPWDTLEPVE